MHKIYEVFGLLEDAQETDSTVRDLREHGVPAEQIEVMVPAAGQYPLADEHLHEDLVGARHGALNGLLLGLVAGLLVALAAPAIETMSTQALLVAIAFGGFGATIGAVAGMMLHELADDDQMQTRSVIAPTAARLIAVRSDDRVGRAHRILERHGALFLDDTSPLIHG